jgi:hypothetical protein
MTGTFWASSTRRTRWPGELGQNRTFQAQRDSMDSISMSRLCKSQAAVGGAIDEISSRLIVFDYRNTQPRVRQ